MLQRGTELRLEVAAVLFRYQLVEETAGMSARTKCATVSQLLVVLKTSLTVALGAKHAGIYIII